MSLKTLETFAAGMVAALMVALVGPVTANAGPPSLVWEKHPGTSDYDYVNAVAVDSTGAVVVAGATWGSMARPHLGTLADAFFVKYSAAGAVVWRRQLSTYEGDEASGVATDQSNNVIVVGRAGTALFGIDGRGLVYFVAKYAPDGTLLWMKPAGGANVAGGARVAVDASASIFVSRQYDLTFYPADGTYQRSIGIGQLISALAVAPDGDAVIAGYYNRSPQPSESYIAKVSPTGQLRWILRPAIIGRSSSINAIAVNQSGGIFAVGSRHYDNSGENHAHLVALSPEGTILWRRYFASSYDSDGGNGAAVDPAGNVIISGQRFGVRFTGAYTPDNVPLWKLSTKSRWQTQLPAAGSLGDVFVAGTIATAGGTRGWTDGYVAKYAYPAPSLTGR